MKNLFLTIMAMGLLMSCGNQYKKSQEITRPIQQTIINYSEGKEDKETVDYQYEKPDDAFWVKAIYKDNSGKQLRVINRELSPKSRLPIKEYMVDELGDTDEIWETEYSPKTHLLLKKTVYAKSIAAANKIAENVYNYNDAVLETYSFTSYSIEADYKNVDGNNITEQMTLRYLPAPSNRPKGNVETLFKVEKRKKYCTKDLIERFELTGMKPGDIYYTEDTKFDPSGMPISYISTDPAAGAEHKFSKEFYLTKVDSKGRLTEITPYANEKRDSVAENALKWEFEYSDDRISKITEYMYNPKTKIFDLIHGRDEYKWPEYYYSRVQTDLSDATVISESFCQHRQIYSKNDRQIEKFDKSEKIVVTRTASLDGGFPKENMPGTITQKSITKYETVKKK